MEIQETSFFTLGSAPTTNEQHGKSGLEEWYERVYKVPFSRFSAEDLARSCRQNLFPEYIVPHVLRWLKACPLAGGLYEGELFNSLTYLPASFWKQNIPCRENAVLLFNEMKAVLKDALEYDEFSRLENFFLAFIKSEA